MGSIQPRWLSLKDAALYASIGRNRLVDLAKAGVIKGFSDPDSKRHDWIFDRLSLDSYRENQADPARIRKKALDIMSRTGL